jgi:hypothetical protein
MSATNNAQCSVSCWTPYECSTCGNDVPPRGRSVSLEANPPQCCLDAQYAQANQRHWWNREEWIETLRHDPRGRPTMLDRVEAAHWARAAGHSLISYANSVTDRKLSPTVEAASRDLEHAIELIETARKALNGQHSRGGTSILADLDEGGNARQVDLRTVYERTGGSRFV